MATKKTTAKTKTATAKDLTPIDNKPSKVEDIGEQIVKSKRGSKSASIEINNTATKEEIAEIVSNNYKYFNLPIVKTDEECAQRLNMFFQEMVKNQEIPTVEKMCLALGTTRVTVWEWEQGSKGQARAYMIKKAKEILAAIDAELVSRGKIPQVTYIFRAKNFFGLVDKQEYVLTPNSPLGAETDPEEIQRRLEDGIADIE